MMIRRLTALLTLLLLMAGVLPAAAQDASSRDAAWFGPVLHASGSLMHLLTDEQLTRLAQLPSEDIHAIVEGMFAAAAGVREQEELALWKTLRTDSERAARSLHNAAHRTQTLPWLINAFAPGNRPEDGEEIPYPAAAPAAAQTDTAAPESTPEPQWTAEDGYAALSANDCGQAFLALLQPLGGTDAQTCLAVSQAAVQRWLAELDHAALSGINGHYQFWLYAAGTPIDYPVVQCGNNSYYMDRMFNRKENPAGTIFVDYRNLSGFRDPNTLIYGHHMRDSSMFHALTDYESAGFFDAHPFMVIISAEEIRLVELFAGYVTDKRDHCYDIALSDEGHMREFVDKAVRKSNFVSHVEINCRSDHLITLSTCAYNFDNARYVVLGRLDLVWEKTVR